MAGSVYVSDPLAVTLSLWLLLPFDEEPWLRETYGEAYERYREWVPRFVGLPSMWAETSQRSGSSELYRRVV